MNRSTASLMELLSVIVLVSPSLSEASDRSNNTDYCGMFKAAHSELAGFTGLQIDPITNLLKVTVHCAQKTFVVRQWVHVPTKRLRGDWVERRDKAWTDRYCKPGSDFREAVLNGWTVQSRIATVDGFKVSITAQCFDAIADNKLRRNKRI